MIRRMIKALSLIFAFIISVSVFLIPVSAYTAPIINPCDDSYVVDDLTKMGYNTYDYVLDPSANFLQVIHFLEYAYSSTDHRYYSLYLYLYNPSGKKISESGSNIQLCYTGSDGKESKYIKYSLEVVNASKEQGCENVFYKFKVKGVKDIASNINPSKRTYNLASVEILYEGESKPVTKTLRSSDDKNRCKWTYTGYQSGFGSATKDGTLRYDVDVLDTIPVELHDASWMSDTSNLGVDYRWEVKSFYFNIPKSYIEKYGDPFNSKSNTQGLYAVEGEYYKYGLNGLIVPDQELYNSFNPIINYRYDLKDHTFSAWPSFATDFTSGNATDHSKPSGGQIYSQYDSLIGFNLYNGTKYFSNSSNIDFKSSIGLVLQRVNLLSRGNSNFISGDELKSLWESSGKPTISDPDYLLNGEIISNLGERVEFDVKVTDGDLASAIKTYASSNNKWGYLNWLHQWFNKELYTDKEGYSDCYPLIQIQPGDINDFQEEAYLGSNLYLNYDSYLGLKSFYKEKADKNSVYLMRLGVEPYYEDDATLFSSPDSFEKTGDGYYYEKVIYTDCDIFAFTFKDAHGDVQRVPVECDPVDNLGLIVSGNNKVDSNPNQYPKDPTVPEIIGDGLKKLGDFLDSLKGIVILIISTIGIVGILIVIIVFWKYLEPIFVKAGKFLGRIFGFVGKLIFGAFKAVWNIGMTVLFYFTGLDLRIKGDMDFSSGSSKSHDVYDREDRELRRNEDRRREERHQAQMKVLESKSQKNNDTNNKE